jgi:hypothetical protein
VDRFVRYFGDCGAAANEAVPALLPLLMVSGDAPRPGRGHEYIGGIAGKAADALSKITGSGDVVFEYLDNIVATSESKREVAIAQAKLRNFENPKFRWGSADGRTGGRADSPPADAKR